MKPSHALLAAILAASCAFGQDAKPRTVDKKFIALAGADAALLAWDETQTLGCLRHVPGCSETNPLYGPHPSAARLFGLALAVDAGYALGSYELRRHGPAPLRKFWFSGLGYGIAGHAQGIATSYHGGNTNESNRDAFPGTNPQQVRPRRRERP